MKFFLLLLSLTSSIFAAPANDIFASRIALGNAANISATGDNTAATLEANENDLDSLGGRSIWWKWTAPTTAWVNVDTEGSAIDTVLAVLADGPALRDTYIVGFNDESGNANATPGTSRVIFQAVAGTEYHIAIHGFLGAQGAVKLNVHSGITPPLRVTSLTLAPGSVNVTAASQTIVADIGIASDAGFSEGELVLHRAAFSGTTEIPLLPASRISGTSTAGVYRVNIAIPRYSSPGTWLLEVALSDALGHEAVFGRGVAAAFEYDHVLPDGLAGLLSVANTGAVDAVAPVLASFAISPATANVTLNSAALNFTFRIADSLSGFGSATLTIFTPTGQVLVALPITAAQRTLGTALDGTFTVPFSLPAKMPSGTWSVSLLIRDATGNPALYDGAINGSNFPLGATSGEFTVTGVAHSYWAWMYPRTTATPNSQPSDDFDGDGISNLLEFAFGTAADEPDSKAGLPVFEYAGSLKLTYIHRVDAATLGIAYTPQFSSDLVNWTNAAGGVVTPTSDVMEQVTISDPAPAGGHRFGRVKVTLPQ